MPVYEVGEYEDIEQGEYNAVVQSVEFSDKPSQFDNKTQLVIKYNLNDLEAEDGSDIIKSQWINEPRGVTPKSKLYQIFSAILNDGQPLEKGQSLDTAQLVGKRCCIYYGSYTKKDGTTGIKIVTVSPPKKRNGGGAARRRTEPDEEPIDPETPLDPVTAAAKQEIDAI